MQKPAAYLTAILVGAIVWFFFQHFRIEGMESLQVVAKLAQGPSSQTDAPQADAESDENTPTEDTPSAPTGTTDPRTPNPAAAVALSPNTAPHNPAAAPSATAPQQVRHRGDPRQQFAPPRTPETIQVASFHLHFFGSSADNPEITMNAVARVVRLFDVLALQGLSPGGEASLADLVAKAGKKYDYLVADSVNTDQVLAFVYNRDTIVADRGAGFYTLGDPDDLLRRDPLIGWFRAKQAPEDRAFTFTLVNVHTERRHAIQELNVLDDVFQEVRRDWRDEDDVIMLGCFQRPDTKLADWIKVPGLTPMLRDVATNVQGDEHTENMLFRRQETGEFTGRSGVFHFLRAYNLSLNQALQVSDFLPIWAEFSIYESHDANHQARTQFSTERG